MAGAMAQAEKAGRNGWRRLRQLRWLGPAALTIAEGTAFALIFLQVFEIALRSGLFRPHSRVDSSPRWPTGRQGGAEHQARTAIGELVADRRRAQHSHSQNFAPPLAIPRCSKLSAQLNSFVCGVRVRCFTRRAVAFVCVRSSPDGPTKTNEWCT